MKQNTLLKENILLELKSMTKEDAITTAGNLLVKNGYVKENYVKSMLEKEKTCNTYIGNSIAIPHGTNDSKNEILKSGIVILQFKDGIDYGDDKAYLVIGIAGVNDEHLEILSKIAIAIEDMNTVNKIIKSNSRTEICNILSIDN